MTNIVIPEPIQCVGFKLYPCKQGSPEWLAMRAGVITASEFKVARGKLKRNSGDKKVGDWTDAAENLAFRKAIERISKVPLDENHTTWQMKRGHELEPYARMAHEDRLLRMPSNRRGAGLMVEQAGFVTTDDGVFGASADGFMGEHGGSEYKCLVSAKGLRAVIMDDDISDFMDQVQGCMWISGRDWWHFGLYCPALRPVHLEFKMIEVERDQAYIDALEEDLIEFNRVVDGMEHRLLALGAEAVEEAKADILAKLAEKAGAEEPAEVE
jgi:hypothetical protein